MSLSGKFELESAQQYPEFMRTVGIDPGIVAGQHSTNIYDGDIFTLTKFYMNKTWSNSFIIGKESNLKSLDGKEFQTTATKDGGKLKIQFPNYIYTAEVVGDELTEVHTAGSSVSKIISKKIQ